MADEESTVPTPSATASMTCPFCDGDGEIAADEVEYSSSWGRDIRKRVRQEITNMRITQDVFACASLGNRQSHLSQILREADNQRPQGRRLEAMLHIDAFLRLPQRCRQDIYEHVASDPFLFVRMASFHARLLREDAGTPGLSHIARAVLDRFASEITLYPNPSEVNVLADSLNLQPEIIRSHFTRLSTKLTSSSHCPNVHVAEFKVPYAREKPETSATHMEKRQKFPLFSTCSVAATQTETPTQQFDGRITPNPDGGANEWTWPSLMTSSPKPDAPETDDSFVRALLASPSSRHSSPPREGSVYDETLGTPAPREDHSDAF